MSACLSVSLRSSGIAFFYMKPKLSKGFRTVLFVFFPCDSQTRALSCYVQGSGLSASLKCGRVDQGERRRLRVTQDLPIVHFCPGHGLAGGQEEATYGDYDPCMTRVWLRSTEHRHHLESSFPLHACSDFSLSFSIQSHM